MTGHPDRIWLQHPDDAPPEGAMWCEDKVWPDHLGDKEHALYVRVGSIPGLSDLIARKAVLVPVDDCMREHLQVASMCLPIREYQGGMWFGQNHNLADATFVDYGASRSFAAIVSAMIAASPYVRKT
jgi:hypothetical protein